MIIKLENNEIKTKEYNDLCEELKTKEPSIDWEKHKINNIYDKFIPYDLWVKELSQEKDIKLINDVITEKTDNIYISHLNWKHDLERLTNYKDCSNYFNYYYGVSDNASQVLDYYNTLLEDNSISKDKKYIIVLTPITKRSQPMRDGWRWQKSGEYIGIQNPEHEYLYYEKDIDLVYVFGIREVKEEGK